MMTNKFYYLLSFLPPLPSIGETPPITAEEVLKLVDQEKSKELKFLAEIFQLESLISRVAHRILTTPLKDRPSSLLSIADFENIPPFLSEILARDPDEEGEDKWMNQLQRAWFNYIEEMGKFLDSTLLKSWVDWEKSLRDQLTDARMLGKKDLEIPKSEPIETRRNHQELIFQWRSAKDPMAGERLLDEARMQFIDDASKRYTFSLDELIAYLLKLGILSRYTRLNREEAMKLLKETATL
jgi:hypothetical protein